MKQMRQIEMENVHVLNKYTLVYIMCMFELNPSTDDGAVEFSYRSKSISPPHTHTQTQKLTLA